MSFGLVMRQRTDYSVHLELIDPDPRNAVQWQVFREEDDESGAARGDTGWDAVALNERWMPAARGILCKARARIRSPSNVTGPWSNTVHWKQKHVEIMAGGALFDPEGFGETPLIPGEYVELQASSTLAVPSNPELSARADEFGWSDGGFRGRLAYVITNPAFATWPINDEPSNVHDAVNYTIPAGRGDGNYDGFTIILAVTPTVYKLGFPYGYVLLGCGVNWWLSQLTDGTSGAGTLYFQGGLQVGNILKVFGVSGTINHQEPTLIVLRHRPAHWHTSSATCPGAAIIDQESITTLWTNGAKSETRLDAAIQHSGFGICALPGGGDAANYGIGDIGFGTPFITVGGHQSSGPQAEQQGARRSFTGIMHAMAYRNNFMITDAQVASLQAAFNADNVDLFYERLAALSPLILDRYNQPKPPNKPSLTVA